MSFSIILEDRESSRLKAVRFRGNESLFVQFDEARYPLLSRLDETSYDTFGADQMDALLTEMASLRPKAADMAAHLEEVRGLAGQCLNMPGSTLTFTPFE